MPCAVRNGEKERATTLVQQERKITLIMQCPLGASPCGLRAEQTPPVGV